MEHVWYIRNRNYDIAIGEIIVAYNSIVMVDKIAGRAGTKIISIVS